MPVCEFFATVSRFAPTRSGNSLIRQIAYTCSYPVRGVSLPLEIAEGPWIDEEAGRIRFKVRFEGVLIRFQISVDRLETAPIVGSGEKVLRLFDDRQVDILQQCFQIIDSRRFHLSKEAWLELT